MVSPPILLDDIDRQLISHLQTDGHRPYGTIAMDLGLSAVAFRSRIKKLRESGVVHIVAVADPLQLGFARQAFVGIRVRGDVLLVADAIALIDEFNYVVMTAGSFDIIGELLAVDDDHLLQLLNDSVRSIPGVVEVETFLHLKRSKQTHSWGAK